MLIVRIVVLVGLVVTSVMANAKSVKVSSPDGSVMVSVGVKNHSPYYTVSYQGRTLVAPSRLGYEMNYGKLGENTKMGKVSRSYVDETWVQPWGENDSTRNHYHQLIVNFKEYTGQTMQVVFRVFNDGLGFRYILPDYNKGKEYQIQENNNHFQSHLQLMFLL